MGLFDRLFRGRPAAPPASAAAAPAPAPPAAGVGHQLPSGMVAQEFGEVNVADRADRREVDLTILMEPTGADSEGWQTGVAIDGSVSMVAAFGNAFIAGPGAPPMNEALREQLRARGLLEKREIDGQVRSVLTQAGMDELRGMGYGNSPNIVEPVARDFTAYLAERLDADGGTTVIYWACGNGAQYEVLGDFTAEQCGTAAFKGPSKGIGFGAATHLVPAMKYFVQRFADARNGMYVFVTDGKIDDLEQVKRYTVSLCREIEAGARNKLKFVLIGVGDQIDESQMSELDDLDSGTSVDLWDHKIAAEMRQLAEIFAELVSEHQIVAPVGRIVDSHGRTVLMMSDGVPARMRFDLGPDAEWFELVIGEHRIRQPLPPRR